MRLLQRFWLPLVFAAASFAAYPFLTPYARSFLFGPQPKTVDSSSPPFSVLMIGWDGSRRQTVLEMLESGRLPNLKNFIDSGTFIDITINDGRTDTKAGWTQIFTGYSASVTGVHSNRDYRPIPPGLTIFERLKGRYGDKIQTLFFSGKVNNIGARGPHKVCINCKSRFNDTHGKTEWWHEETEAPTRDGGAREFIDREGEPYFYTQKAIDRYINKLGPGPKVLATAKTELTSLAGKAFFAFVHFEEPDEQGHLYSEGSREYISALENNDKNLAELLNFAKDLERSGNREVKVFILSDHGFDGRKHTHRRAPETFWAAHAKNFRPAADRRDFTPTLLELYGFNLRDIAPPLNGRSLLQ